jgi:HEAT repeat protein
MRFLAPCTLLLVQTLAAAGGAGSAHAWTVLDTSLTGNAEHREQALAALATLGSNDPEAVRRAVTALDDKTLEVRRVAALTLGELKAASAIPRLTQALDDSPEVSFAAAKALVELGDPAGREVLVAVLAGERRDAPGILANAMHKAKGKLHHPGQLVLMGSQDATGAMFGPVSMVIPAIKDTADLKSKGAPGRAAAAAYLAKYPDEYAVQLLEWALSDDNQFVRLEAAKGLGERGNAGSIAKLEPLLADDHNIVRDMAAVSILRIDARNGAAGDVAPGAVAPPQTSKKKQ